MKKLQMVSALAIAGALVLSGCGGTDVVVGPVTDKAAPPAPVPSVISVDFSAGIDGWAVGVADYTDGTEPSEVASSWKDLPAPLTGKGYYLASHNRSDDVLTYAKRQVGGFVPGAKYALTFEMRYVTDASTDCFG